MAAILNLAILDSAILVFPPKFTHTCKDWFPPFALKKLHSFILTQFDDGSHLEFCHVGFRHCHLGFWHLLIFSQISLKNTLTSTLTLTQTNSIWLKLIHSHLTWWWQPSWILAILDSAMLDSVMIVFPLNVTHTCQDWFSPFAQKNFIHSL